MEKPLKVTCACAGHLRGMSLTPATFSLTQPHSLLVFSRKLWGFLFLTVEPCAGEPNMVLGTFAPQWGPAPLRYPSQFLATKRGCRTISFHISASTPSLHLFFLSINNIFKHNKHDIRDFKYNLICLFPSLSLFYPCKFFMSAKLTFKQLTKRTDLRHENSYLNLNPRFSIF